MLGPLGQRIKKLRGDMSQELLAEKMRVTRQTIGNWESGRQFPDYNNLVDLKRVFGVSWDELMDGHDTDMARIKMENDALKRNKISLTDALKVGYNYVCADDLLHSGCWFLSLNAGDVAFIALELKRRKFLVLTLNPEGFDIYFKNIFERDAFESSVKEIQDGLIHSPIRDGRMNEECSKYETLYEIYATECQKAAYEELFGIKDGGKIFILYDREGNDRGIAGSEDTGGLAVFAVAVVAVAAAGFFVGGVLIPLRRGIGRRGSVAGGDDRAFGGG